MSESFRVKLTKDYLVFSAAHFITFNGNICERLHGHNYRVAAEVDGPLDENSYVIDFIALRDYLKQMVDELDHRVILPAQHPRIRVVADDREVIVTFEERRWIFPLEDCVILPVPNTTAELVAKYFGDRLLSKLAELGCCEPSALRIGVDENNGQWAEWEWTADA
ncbi:MAG: 6-pyruvoyl tetrahydropterin synthase family protein [Pirellulaceae bacterium]|nr:6-pyruvoyl tetrahydropterin synthase family protein [Pirellulaceae bacterium]